MADRNTILALARRVVNHEIAFDGSDELDALTEAERREVCVLAVYELQRRHRPANQRTAMRLLRSWLTPQQARELSMRGHVTVVGSLGGVYRLRPQNALCERVERHGKNWYRVATYCYHDVDSELPAADVSLAQLLILATDEARFRAEANETKCWPECWDSEYMRRRAAIRRGAVLERAAA